ncbi:MAG: hypothetical protein ABSH10_03080 [Phycisphaerae bacterium]|jgi:hypothetical protein
MANEIVEQAVASAVQQSYDAWAAQHPGLAAVIDRIALTSQAAQSLRDSAEYKQAVADFQQGMTEANLLSRLMDLAEPILAGILKTT